MKFAVLLLLVASSYAGSPHYQINGDIERILKTFNKFMYDNAFDEVVLPDVALDAAPIFIGTTLSNMSTIVRKGDCEMWADGEDLKVKMILGLEDMQLHVYMVPFTGNHPVTWYMSGTTVELGITLHTKETNSARFPDVCSSTWDYIKILNLGNIFMRTPNKLYNDKSPPKELTSLVMDYYNQQLNGENVLSIKKLDQKIDLCNLSIKQ